MNPIEKIFIAPNVTKIMIMTLLLLIPLYIAPSDTISSELLFTKGETSRISGHVHDLETNPVIYACISVYDASSGDSLGQGYSDQNGYFEFSFTDAPSEQIKVHVQPYYGTNLIAQFYDGSQDMDHADIIEAPAGCQIQGIDFFLPKGGVISGHVRFIDGLPASKITVHAYSYENLKGVASGRTDHEGHYNVVGLPTGTYVVEFDKIFLPSFTLMSGYYDNKEYLCQGDPVPVTAGLDTTGIDYTVPTFLCDIDGSGDFEPDIDLKEFVQTIGEEIYPNLGDFDYDGEADGMDIYLMDRSVASSQEE